MKTKFLLASNNEHKQEEYSAILGSFGVEVLLPRDLKIDVDVLEDGKTYIQNSKKKAFAIREIMNVFPIISDDSGLEIDALENQLGVQTHRFLDQFASKKEVFEYVISKTTELNNTKAKFVCVITLIEENGTVKTFKGISKGNIIKVLPERLDSFGFDPIFIPDGFEHTFDLLDAKTKNLVSHRGKATHKLIHYLQRQQILK